jgi:hypothetical protein
MARVEFSTVTMGKEILNRPSKQTVDLSRAILATVRFLEQLIYK